MQTYKADFYNALYVPPGSKPHKPYMRMLLTFAEILSTLRGCRQMEVKVIIFEMLFTLVVSLNIHLKDLLEA